MHLLDKNQWQGVEVITSDLVAKEHGVSKADINKLYNRNDDKFISEKDVFEISRKLLKSSDDFKELEDLFTNNKQEAVYLIY